MPYPRVHAENITIDFAAKGGSIARFGDGELNICIGRSSVSQDYSPHLEVELRDILMRNDRVLPCIPSLHSCRPNFWEPFYRPPFPNLYASRWYGSSFVTRPDNAPSIDCADYWDVVRSIWRGRNVCYISGSSKLGDIMHTQGARSIYVIPAPLRNAYSEIDRIERQTDYWAKRHHDSPIIIALGAAGTALAARLARKGHWALDLGHIGNFMDPKNIGAFEFTPDQLASAKYRATLKQAHATTNWGRGGASWVEPIAQYARKVEAKDVLDYGAGGRTLAPALAALGIVCKEYDPGVEAISAPPKIADLVVSTDVFEHIEPELIDNVLAHTYRLARIAGYFVVATKPAKKILDDGRNAHLIVQPWSWWEPRFRAAGWQNIKLVTEEWKKFVIKCSK